MGAINLLLAEGLSEVDRPGDFFTDGTVEFLPPQVEVEGVGPIAFPLLPCQAEQLVTVAERAPYGRGQDTLVDTEVRRTWQIDAGRVRIAGKHWARTVDTIVARVAEGLGIAAPIAVELYKLLVYDAGSFFVRHRDTEKAPGMFATLVIVLPSHYTGGELIVRHGDREARVELRCADPSEVAYAAFYADCVHEVLPVTAGCRLTLVYNLCRQDVGPPPTVPDYAAVTARLTDGLRAWCAGKGTPADDTPEKLIYPLEHAYTPAELSFAALKGRDAATAGVLAAAAAPAGCELHLALVTIEESGIAEHTAYFGARRRWSDDAEDAFEVEEVCERSLLLSDWCTPDGGRSDLGRLPFDEDELCPPEAFEQLEPDELHFHEATGNEGASFERTYRRAGLVLWPRARKLAVLNQAGLAATLPYLAELIGTWEQSGEPIDSPAWRQAHELAGHMLSTWPRQRWLYSRADAPSEAAAMLGALTRLRDTAHIDAFVGNLVAEGVYGRQDNEALIAALALLTPARSAALIMAVIAGNAATLLSACGDLLARASSLQAPGNAAALVPAATALVAALPGHPERSVPPPWPWSSSASHIEPEFVVDLLSALDRIDTALASRAVDHLLAWPAVYGFDAVLVPALLRWAELDSRRDAPAVRRLRAAVLEHLRARIAEPLEPPGDWRRASQLACRCADCAALGRFLADPDLNVWHFKAAEAHRRHLEESARRSRADLDLATDTRGRPYTLVCTKNQASYDRRAKQRKEDLEAQACLQVAMS